MGPNVKVTLYLILRAVNVNLSLLSLVKFLYGF